MARDSEGAHEAASCKEKPESGVGSPDRGLNTQWQAGRSVSSSLPETLTAPPHPFPSWGLERLLTTYPSQPGLSSSCFVKPEDRPSKSPASGPQAHGCTYLP